MQITSVTIGGVEVVSLCHLPATEITKETGGRISTCTIELIEDPLSAVVDSDFVDACNAAAARISPKAEIIISSGGTVLFGGYVVRMAPFRKAPGVMHQRLTCQDYTVLLDSVVIESATFTARTDEQILDTLFSTYLPAVSTTDVVSVGTIDSLAIEDLTMRQAIERIVERTRADWYIDASKKLQYNAVGAVAAPWGFSENPDNVTTFPFLKDFTYEEDVAALANTITVTGLGSSTTPAATEIASSVTADGGSTARYGNPYPPDAGLVGTSVAGTIRAQNSYRVPPSDFYYLEIAMVRFDTSAIPDDATVNSATLSLYLTSVTVADAGSQFGIDYYASSNWPVSDGDYTSSPPATPTAVNWVALSSLGTGAYQNYALSSPGANINLTGYTGFRLYVKTLSGAPTGENIVEATGTASASNQPKLSVSYTATVAGVTGSYTESASVTLYGTIQKHIVDRSILTDAEADLRAEIEAAMYAYPLTTATVRFRKDGLDVGDYVPLDVPSLGVSGSYVLRRLQMRWRTQSDVDYTAELGDYRADLIRLLRRIS